MNGRKAKAMRKVVGYHPTKNRPELPPGGWRSGTCHLSKKHPRRAYKLMKRRYAVIPFAGQFKRISAAAEMLNAVSAPV